MKMEAAMTGDMALFNQFVAIHGAASAELEQHLLSQKTDTKENIIHVAVKNGHEAFIRELEMQLPSSMIVALICQQDHCGCNPLHIAAGRGHLEIVKILIQSYHKFSKIITVDEANTCSETRVVVGDHKVPPWTATTQSGKTPLHMAIVNGHEEVAAYILSQDMETLCNMVDYDGKSPLYLAVEKGVERVALQILTSGCAYNLGRLSNNQMVLHNASQITEQVAIILLERHPELLRARDSRGESFLHELAFMGELESLQCLLKGNVFLNWSASYRSLLRERNNFGSNPIHRAVLSGKVEVIKLLIDAYFQVEPSNGGNPAELPWLHMDCRGETPLDVAIRRRLEDMAIYLLTLDSIKASLSNIHGTNPLFLAVECGCSDIAERILWIGSPTLLRSGPGGKNPLHVASKCPGIADIVAELLGIDLIDMKDASGKAPLDYAAQVGDIHLMEKAFKHSGISSTPYAWVEACKGGHMDAFRMFMNNCDFKQLCLEQRDTPLHHIQLKSKEEYEEFLAIPLIGQLKNALDIDGVTPLHQAIERKDIVFVELLLGTHGIDWNIKDKNGQTGLNLLAKLCDEFPDWDAMCNRIHLNPRIKTSYIPLKANMAEIRTTLSVVAALLATITFAAGFTIPGGYNDDGHAILSRKAAFIVFLLSDTYAMCCSMLVLFCLIWAMVCDPDKSLILVDRSVVILQQALYGTLVAFMTGVYTVVSHDCLWTAIVVCVMCSVVAIAANKSVLYDLLNRFIPSTR